MNFSLFKKCYDIGAYVIFFKQILRFKNIPYILVWNVTPFAVELLLVALACIVKPVNHLRIICLNVKKHFKVLSPGVSP